MELIKSIKKDNKGTSLIEVIVVVVIMGILATAVVVNISTVYGRNASNAAQKLGNFLEETRMEAMNRTDGRIYVEVAISGDKIMATRYYVDASGNKTAGDTEELGNTGLTVTLKSADGSSQTLSTVTATGNISSIIFAFNKATGAFTKKLPASLGTLSEAYSDVIFTGSKTSDLVLVWNTGRCYVK